MFAPPIARTKPKSGAAPRSTAVTPSSSRAGAPQPFNMGDRARLTHAVQPKLKAGGVNDPLEREADRVAGQIVTGPDAQPPRLRADATGALTEPERTTSPDSFSGRGDPLPTPIRGYFERRFGHDFTGVRLHHGPDAAQSALSFGARAYTHGRDIVFGAGEFSPSSNRTKLLAHELAHVVQQGAGQPVLQRSPLSDEVKEAFTKDPKLETLLAQLSRADVQAAQTDADVDAEIASILAGSPDDLWVAQQIRQGRLEDAPAKPSSKKKSRPIEAFFFRGSTDRRALVIGGVHGTEKQGIDVAKLLIKDLQSVKVPPVLTTIVVPSLFPDNAARGSRNSGDTPTNRNFPAPSKSLADAANKKGTAFDALGKVILPENQLLMKLMERFRPERIISIHGTHHLGAAGITFDRRTLRADEVKAARDEAKGMAYMMIPPDQQDQPGGQERLRVLEQNLFQSLLASLSGHVEQTDSDLSLRAAKQIDTATAGITGRDARELEREHDPKKLSDAEKTAREAHPSIAGNIGKTGKIDFAQWSGGGSDPGFSLGGYAPARGMSVFTVEPPVDAPLTAYPAERDPKDPKKPDKTKWAKDRVSGEVDKLLQADRITELKAYADAVRTVLLGS